MIQNDLYGLQIGTGTGKYLRYRVQIFEDTDNLDDIISPSGQPYGKIDSSGNVTILSSNGTYKKPSELNPDSEYDKNSLRKYALYLSRDLEIANKGITIGTGQGTKLGSENPAFIDPNINTKRIYLNYKGGSFSNKLDNVNQFKNLLKHEIYHVDNTIAGIIENYETHADIYLLQMKHDSFKNSKSPYKINIGATFVNYLLNIDRDYKKNNTDYNHQTMIISRINKFNNENVGVMSIIAPENGQYFLGQLNLKLQVEGYPPVNIDYTYENK